MIRPAAYRHLGGPSRSARADSQDIAALATDAVIRNLPGAPTIPRVAKVFGSVYRRRAGELCPAQKKPAIEWYKFLRKFCKVCRFICILPPPKNKVSEIKKV